MMQRRKYYARIAMCIIGAVAAFLLASRIQAFSLLAGQERQHEPVISTDKSAYLAGETIRISGQDFPPLASVMVQVTHADGTAEGGMGHVPFFIAADAAGSIDATWTISETETAGAKFIVTAVAPS